ncbi:MAG: glycosyltransferase [Solirubrobacteraceae bacterium]
MTPRISVVVPTRDRPDSLAALLQALRVQSLPAEDFELIVVDDGSADSPLMAHEQQPTQLIRHERSRGPGAARNTGWRAARAPVIAFIDDDCVPGANWLAALLDAHSAAGSEWTIVQGRVEPDPAKRCELGPLSHTIEVSGPDRLFACANIAYSRALLDRLGGFDERLSRSGEDVDLGARALEAGADAVFSAEALVYHAVSQPGLPSLLRHTLKWTDSVRVLSMHPELRDLLVGRVFWKRTHPLFLLAVVGLLSRRPALAAGACLPYIAHYRRLYRGQLGRLATALPIHAAVDATELATVLAGSVRYRTLML